MTVFSVLNVVLRQEMSRAGGYPSRRCWFGWPRRYWWSKFWCSFWRGRNESKHARYAESWPRYARPGMSQIAPWVKCLKIYLECPCKVCLLESIHPQSNVTPFQGQNQPNIGGSRGDMPPSAKGPSLASGALPNSNNLGNSSNAGRRSCHFEQSFTITYRCNG